MDPRATSPGHVFAQIFGIELASRQTQSHRAESVISRSADFNGFLRHRHASSAELEHKLRSWRPDARLCKVS